MSLNPCFNGRYSQSGSLRKPNILSNNVLILVLMEDTLREDGKNVTVLKSLNPCFNGRYSQRA